MLGLNSIWHWVIVLLIVVLVFGTKKLSNIGKDLGGAIKGFKEGMKEGDDPAASKPAEPVANQDAAQQGRVIDVEAREKSRE